MGSQPIYVIDASSLIRCANFYPRRVFPTIWEKFEQKCAEDCVISSQEIYEDLERRGGDFIQRWAKDHIKFIETSEEVQRKAKEILAQWPNLIKPTKINDSSSSDPFLIAVAILNNGIVITDEAFKRARSQHPKMGIPFVCQSLGIKWISLLEFFEQIGIKY